MLNDPRSDALGNIVEASEKGNRQTGGLLITAAEEATANREIAASRLTTVQVFCTYTALGKILADAQTAYESLAGAANQKQAAEYLGMLGSALKLAEQLRARLERGNK